METGCSGTLHRMRPPHPLPPVFRGRDAVEAGLLTRHQLRGPHVQRLFVGVYCPSGRRVDHVLRCHAVALLGEGQLVLTGRSAATVRGLPLARTHDAVEVLLLGGQRLNRRAGLDVRAARIGSGDHLPWNGIRIASPVRAAFDVMSRGSLPEAVAALDQLLHTGSLTQRQVAAFLTGRHDDGVVQARAVLELSDPRAESQPESVVRVVLARAGIVLTPQVVVEMAGREVARVDLGEEALRLAVEYDGRWHAERGAFTRDRERLNRIHAAGWEVVTITAEMLARPRTVVDLVGAAMARRRRDLRALTG